ncbi:hypothetical protein ACU4GD_38070 [Cupriavidus basilensis]
MRARSAYPASPVRAGQLRATGGPAGLVQRLMRILEEGNADAGSGTGRPYLAL